MSQRISNRKWDQLGKSNLEVVSEHYEAGVVGDLGRMVANFAPGIEWTEAAGTSLAGTYVGVDAVIENVFAAIARNWDQFRVDVDALYSDGDVVIGLGSYRGVNHLTGRPHEGRFAHVWRLLDGRVTAFEQIVDSVMFPA